MTRFHDLFVGTLAILFGGLLLAGAILNLSWLMTLAKPRMLAESFGNTGARSVIALIGAVSIALGLLIASGWRIHW